MRGSLHRSWWRWLEILPAAFSLVLLAFVSCGTVSLDVTGDPVAGFDEHTLCRAGDEGSPRSDPTDRPAPNGRTHGHLAFCCLGHQLPAAEPVLVQAREPVNYAIIVREEPQRPPFIAVPLYDARAPPTQA